MHASRRRERIERPTRPRPGVIRGRADSGAQSAGGYAPIDDELRAGHPGVLVGRQVQHAQGNTSPRRGSQLRPADMPQTGPSSRSKSRNPVRLCSSYKPVVVGHDPVEVISEGERRSEVERIERAQRRGR